MKLLNIVNDSYKSKIECKSILFTSVSGEAQVLDGHADGFFVLKHGIVEVMQSDGSKVKFSIRNGLISFLDKDDATLLSDSIEIIQ